MKRIPHSPGPLRSVGFVEPWGATTFGVRGGKGRRWFAVLVLAVVSVLLAHAFTRWLELRRVHDERQKGEAESFRAVAPRPVPKPAMSPQETARINRVIRSLNAPWGAIFEALESAASREVAVISIEADVERGAVRVVTEGPALDALLAHAERIQASPRFVTTRLVRVEPPDVPDRSERLSRLSFDLLLAQ